MAHRVDRTSTSPLRLHRQPSRRALGSSRLCMRWFCCRSTPRRRSSAPGREQRLLSSAFSRVSAWRNSDRLQRTRAIGGQARRAVARPAQDGGAAEKVVPVAVAAIFAAASTQTRPPARSVLEGPAGPEQRCGRAVHRQRHGGRRRRDPGRSAAGGPAPSDSATAEHGRKAIPHGAQRRAPVQCGPRCRGSWRPAG